MYQANLNTYDYAVIEKLQKEIHELCAIYNSSSYLHEEELIYSIREKQNELLRIEKEVQAKIAH